MDKNLKLEWLTALRSGRYSQCTGQICKTDKHGNKSYCPLGVLNEISNRAFSYDLNEDLYAPVWYSLDDKKSGIPHVIQNTISNMNDGGKSFSEIADWIEENL